MKIVLQVSLEAPGPVVTEVPGPATRVVDLLECPVAAKFGQCDLANLTVNHFCPEALIHFHFKLLGAWILPLECNFCGVHHAEGSNVHVTRHTALPRTSRYLLQL
jgi:hypothetical protein